MKPVDLFEHLQNRWENVYWFSRKLINGDKYGGIGKDSLLLSQLTNSLKLIKHESDENDDTVKLQKQTIKIIVEKRFKSAKSKYERIQRLLTDLDFDIKTSIDIEVFILTCEYIMIPLNQAIDNIPNDDKQFTLDISKAYLDIQHEKGLATVINMWDDLGVKGCLTAERTEIVKACTFLNSILSKNKNIKEIDKNIIITAFVQEFERRAGQKRKRRAGKSLEDVTNFILKYYGIKKADSPEHFQADIEVDNWVKTKDKWLIGISCKRTLRERWKQVSSADASILSKYKIKNIFHVVTFDEDLSDDKLTLLGGHRHIFYLPDNSRRLKYASEHIGLKDYVRPISKLISDLNKEIK